MRAAKILGGIVLGLVGLAVLLYLILVFINRNDRPPSAAVLRFRELVAARPVVEDRDNAFVYMLGMTVPADQDPFEAGAKRRAMLEAFSGNDPEPQVDGFESASSRSAIDRKLLEDCPDDTRKCATAFQALAAEWVPDAGEQLRLERFRTLLTLRQWREVVPPHFAAPFPSYTEIFEGQRLHMLSLAQHAAQGDFEAVRQGIDADHEYWRTMQASAQTLLYRMLAAVGLRHHFYYSNLLLRALPPAEQAQAIPAGWRREFSAEELSSCLAFAGEAAFTQRMVSDVADPESSPSFDEASWLERVTYRISRPLFKVQDSVNLTADAYARICEGFEIPISDYEAARQSLLAERGSRSFLSLYNPMGRILGEISAAQSPVSRVYRSANAEGMRRASLLVAEARARGLDANGVAAEISRSELRDPYDDQPFDWDADRRVVIFDAREDESRPRFELVYD